MSKGFGALVSLDGLSDTVKKGAKAFKESVKPVDVITGAVAYKVLGPLAQKYAISKLAAYFPTATFLARPDVQSVLQGILVGGGLYLGQGGKGRAAGHLVGAVGLPVVEIVSGKLAGILPVSGLVEYDGYGILTQDGSYGILTQDASYGAEAYGEPTEYGMAELSAYSHQNSESADEGDDSYA